MYALLLSEQRKFFSFGWCNVGLIGTIIIPLLYLLTSDLSPIVGEGMLSFYLQALYLGQSGIILASSSFFGQEYSHASLRTTLLAQPSRMKLLYGKLVNITITVLFTGIATSITCFIVLLCFQNTIWMETSILAYIKHTLIVMISWIQLAWLTSAITIIVKSYLISVAIMLPFVLGFSHMLFSISQSAKFLPTLSTMNVYTITDIGVYLTKWSGVLVQFFWVTLFLTIASYVFLYRDVR